MTTAPTNPRRRHCHCCPPMAIVNDVVHQPRSLSSPLFRWGGRRHSINHGCIYGHRHVVAILFFDTNSDVAFASTCIVEPVVRVRLVLVRRLEGSRRKFKKGGGSTKSTRTCKDCQTASPILQLILQFSVQVCTTEWQLQRAGG